MTAGNPSAEHLTASDPNTPPHVLTELAGRRWDLHGLIAANPAAPAELVHWVRSVNPAVAPEQTPPPPYPSGPATSPAAPWPARPAPRRRGVGGWLAGCGCLVVVAIVCLVAFTGVGAALLSGGTSTTDRPSTGDAPTTGTGVDAQLALYDEERARIDELSYEFDGSPVAWLVADFEWLFRQDEKMADPDLNEYTAQAIAAQTTMFREGLEVSVAEAQARRTNATGSVTEGIVDAAGKGFVDIQWDAATACTAANRENWRTTGCITKEDSLTVHMLPESELGEWTSKFTVVHELAHIYQRADNASYLENNGDYKTLLEQGLFQGSEEVMADCFALTHYDLWTLENDGSTTGYGYVCQENERQKIREWAATINAPLG
ncbi:variant leucine-rich repeat-containing protein [Microbacterium sp. NPDC055903]